MISSVPRDDSPVDLLQRQPDEVGGFETECPYLVVDDADAVYARACAGGAQIVLEIHDADYGGRGFTCRDNEGHLWHVGSYDPWQAPAPKRLAGARAPSAGRQAAAAAGRLRGRAR